MLRFFRKYNKILLSVFASVLMVVFLLPGAQMFMPDPMTQPFGYIDGQPFTGYDNKRAADELQILEQLGISTGIEEPAHWLMIQLEARRQGIHTSEAQGRAQLDALAQEMTDQGVNLSNVLRRWSVDETFMIQTLRHMVMFRQLSVISTGMGHISVPRLRHFAQNSFSQATVKMVVVDAKHLLAQASEPTEQQIEEHFYKYREYRPGASEPYGFGYRLEPHLKLEYISVPLDRIESTLTIDEVKARRYYLEHPDEFKATAPQPSEAQADDDSDAASDTTDDSASAAPANSDGTEPGLKPYKEVRQQIIDTLRRDQAKAIQGRIVKWLSMQLDQATRGLPMDAQGYRKLPDDYQPPSMEDLAARAEEEFNVVLDHIDTVDSLIKLSEVNNLTGLNNAYIEVQGRRYNVFQMIANAKGLNDEASLPPALRLQMGIASPILRDDAGNRCIMRLIEVQPDQPPAFLGLVLKEVVNDLKRLDAYKKLVARRDHLVQRGVDEGLKQVAKVYGTQVREIGPFAKYDPTMLRYSGRLQLPMLPVVGQSQDFVDGVFALAQQVQDAGGLEQVTLKQTLDAVPIDRQLRVCLVQLIDYNPIDRRTFAQNMSQIPQFMMMSELSAASEADLLAYDYLKQKLNFTHDGAEKDENNAPPPAPATPANGSADAR